MKHDPHEIEGVLRDARSGLQDKIVRNLGDFTVALLAISGHPEQLCLAGTGTLLVAGEKHFILTARHVWDEVLSSTDHGAGARCLRLSRLLNGSFHFTGSAQLRRCERWRSLARVLVLVASR